MAYQPTVAELINGYREAITHHIEAATAAPTYALTMHHLDKEDELLADLYLTTGAGYYDDNLIGIHTPDEPTAHSFARFSYWENQTSSQLSNAHSKRTNGDYQ